MWVKQDAVNTLLNIYTQGVLPALRETDGCLFAGLVQNVKRHQMCSSITIWRSREKAAAYERSGLYERLLASLQHLFQDTSDLEAGLWEDLKLDYAPTPERPVIVGFEESETPDRHTPTLPYLVHFLPLNSRSDKVGDFRQYFYKNILSLISPQKGFIDAFLMHRLEEHHSFFVLSFWDGSTDSAHLMRRDIIDDIHTRSREVISLDGSREAGKESLAFRCLIAEWFVKDEKKTPA